MWFGLVAPAVGLNMGTVNYIDVSTQFYEYTAYPRPPWLPVSPENVEKTGGLPRGATQSWPRNWGLTARLSGLRCRRLAGRGRPGRS
jgi:hypothetical protein